MPPIRKLNWERVEKEKWVSTCQTCWVVGHYGPIYEAGKVVRRLKFTGTIQLRNGQKQSPHYSQASSCKKWCERMTQYQHQKIVDPGPTSRKDSLHVDSQSESKRKDHL